MPALVTPYYRVVAEPGYTESTDPLTSQEVDETLRHISGSSFPTFNVAGARYGGVPGSASSQLSAINDAIEDAETAGGGVVVLGPGLWNVDGSILVGDNIIFHRMPGSRILQMPGSNSFVIRNRDTVSGNTNVWITGEGEVDGNGANQTVRFSTIALVRCTNVGVKGGTVTGALRTGTFPSVSRHGEGVELIECDDCEVSRVRSHNNAYDGIKTRGCTDVRIYKNRCWDNGRSGIQLSNHGPGGEFGGTGDVNVRNDGTRFFRVSGNYCFHTTGTSSASAPRTSGIYLHPCSDGNIWGNQITGHQQGVAGFDVCEDNVIENNYIGAREQCVAWEETQQANNIVRDNDCVAEGAGGQYLDDHGIGNRFERNRCRIFGGSGTWSIDVTSDASNAEIIQNYPDSVTVNDAGTNTTINQGLPPTAPTTQVLADSATVVWNPVQGNIATLTLGGNRTLANPSSFPVGEHTLLVTQDATGSRTLTLGSNYLIPTGLSVTLSTAAGATDLLKFVCDGSNFHLEDFRAGYTAPVAGMTGIDGFTDGDGSAPPAGWTQRWHTSEITYSEQAAGHMLMDKNAAGRNAISWDELDGFTDGQILCEFQITGTGTTNGGYFAVAFRGSGTDTSESGYLAQLTRNGGADRISIGKYTSAAYTNISDTNKAWAPNTLYRMLVDVSGNNLRAQFYPASGSPSASWDVEVTDSDHSSGWVGCFSFFDSDVEVNFISYGTGGETPPTE